MQTRVPFETLAYGLLLSIRILFVFGIRTPTVVRFAYGDWRTLCDNNNSWYCFEYHIHPSFSKRGMKQMFRLRIGTKQFTL